MASLASDIWNDIWKVQGSGYKSVILKTWVFLDALLLVPIPGSRHLMASTSPWTYSSVSQDFKIVNHCHVADRLKISCGFQSKTVSQHPLFFLLEAFYLFTMCHCPEIRAGALNSLCCAVDVPPTGRLTGGRWSKGSNSFSELLRVVQLLPFDLCLGYLFAQFSTGKFLLFFSVPKKVYCSEEVSNWKKGNNCKSPHTCRNSAPVNQVM